VVTVSGLSGENYLRLLDATGKVITTVKTTNRSQTINVSNLPAGSYVLQVVQNNTAVENIKVIKE
jgi:hypothetical protein